jgi:hypothetical protein
MSELEEILSRKRARRRIISLLVAPVTAFILFFVYFISILVFASMGGTVIDLNEWYNILAASALFITSPFTVLAVYEAFSERGEDRALIRYCNEHPDMKEEVKKIERELSKRAK